MQALHVLADRRHMDDMPIGAKRAVTDNKGYFQNRCYNMEQTRGSRQRLRTRQSIRWENWDANERIKGR